MNINNKNKISIFLEKSLIGAYPKSSLFNPIIVFFDKNVKLKSSNYSFYNKLKWKERIDEFAFDLLNPDDLLSIYEINKLIINRNKIIKTNILRKETIISFENGQNMILNNLTQDEGWMLEGINWSIFVEYGYFYVKIDNEVIKGEWI